MYAKATTPGLVGLTLLLVLGMPLGAAMIEVSLTATKDTNVDRDPDGIVNFPVPQAITNFGARSWVGTSTRLSGEMFRALIDFDSSSFDDIGPQNIVSAEIHLNIFSGYWPWDKSRVQHIEIRRLTHDWVEGVDRAGLFGHMTPFLEEPTGATWFTYDGTNSWPGGPGARGDTGETVVSGEIPFTNEFRIGKGDSRPESLLPRVRSYDVTELIKEAADPNIPFHGFYFEAIRAGDPMTDPAGEATRWGTKEPGGAQAVGMGTTDEAFPSVLNLVLVPEPASVLAVGLGALGLLVRRTRRRCVWERV